MINFNELPTDIKELIFKKNRPATSKEINKNKEKFNIVLDHLEGLIEKTIMDYSDESEEDYDWDFSNAMIECIFEENINDKAESQREELIDSYYNNYD
tara:strand:+ start:44 stop:337 length:294 start_codon:yes stop_codon:yes gene_type:complete